MKREIKLRLHPIRNIGNLCLYAFFVLTVVIFLYQYNSTMFNIRYGFMAIGAFIGYMYCLTKKKKFTVPIIYLLFILTCWFFCDLGQNGYMNYSVTYMFYTIYYIGLSVLILESTYNQKYTIYFYFFAAFTILIKIFQNINANKILLANSRNYISVLLLLMLLFYYISCHDNKKPFYITPVIIYFYITLYATGRGGIISSGFLVLSICIYKLRTIENKKVKYAIYAVIAILIITIFMRLTELDESIMLGKFNSNLARFYEKGIFDQSRVRIWTTFLTNNRKSFSAFLFGSDTKLIRRDGNMHNSFLQAYASFGLIGLSLLMIKIVYSIIQGIKAKDFFWLILFLSLLIRAFTDVIFFQGYCEIFLYYFIFYWDYRKIHLAELSNKSTNMLLN